MILHGHCALELMGLNPFGFDKGREDAWDPEDLIIFR
jgi:catalase (peroxidase I)